jgi:hypothetical protein
MEEPKDKSGVIIYNTPKKTPTPTVTQPDPSKRICGGFACEDVACRNPDKCKMIHQPKPELWDPVTLRDWCTLIDNTPGMSWHSSVDMVKVSKVSNSFAIT